MFHLQTKASRKQPWRHLSSAPETREGRESLHKHRRYWHHFYGCGAQTRIVSDYQLYLERTRPQQEQRVAGAFVTLIVLGLLAWAWVVILSLL